LEEEDKNLKSEQTEQAVKSVKATKAKLLREVPYDPQTFNPFDIQNIRRDEAIEKKLLQPKRMYKEKE
jgi:3-deoxy-D-arabino-heptulosonate 7-phosphate (DAHP) synthase